MNTETIGILTYLGASLILYLVFRKLRREYRKRILPDHYSWWSITAHTLSGFILGPGALLYHLCSNDPIPTNWD